MKRALAVDQILRLLERFTRVAVVALVLALVDVSGLVDGGEDGLYGGAVARLRRAHEVVERNVEKLPHLAEALLPSI